MYPSHSPGPNLNIWLLSMLDMCTRPSVPGRGFPGEEHAVCQSGETGDHRSPQRASDLQAQLMRCICPVAEHRNLRAQVFGMWENGALDAQLVLCVSGFYIQPTLEQKY